MAVPRFNFWGKFRPVIETKKLRKTITLEDFTARCGATNGSFRIIGLSPKAVHNPVISTPALSTAATLEGWIRLEGTTASGTKIYLASVESGSTKQKLQLYVDENNKVVFKILDVSSNTYTVTSVATVPIGQWTFISGTYDGTDMFIYINGVQDTNVETVGANIYSGVTAVKLSYLAISNGTIPFNIADVRIWSTARTSQQILATMYHRRGSSDSGLEYYYPLNVDAATEAINGETITFTPPSQSPPFTPHLDATIYPPLNYGASFIAAQYNVTLPYKSAIQFPVMFPSDIDFMLVVRWTDEDNVIQRRRLNDMEGVDIAPFPEKYTGETLPLTYVFECWNVDGASSITLSTDLVIYTSLTSQPTSDTDHVNVVAVTNPTIDTTLGEPFPVTSFPLEFDTQQSY